MTEDGDLIIRAFAPHPITQTLIDYKEGPADRPGAQRAAAARPARPAPA